MAGAPGAAAAAGAPAAAGSRGVVERQPTHFVPVDVKFSEEDKQRKLDEHLLAECEANEGDAREIKVPALVHAAYQVANKGGNGQVFLDGFPVMSREGAVAVVAMLDHVPLSDSERQLVQGAMEKTATIKVKEVGEQRFRELKAAMVALYLYAYATEMAYVSPQCTGMKPCVHGIIQEARTLVFLPQLAYHATVAMKRAGIWMPKEKAVAAPADDGRPNDTEGVVQSLPPAAAAPRLCFHCGDPSHAKHQCALWLQKRAAAEAAAAAAPTKAPQGGAGKKSAKPHGKK